MSTDITTTSHDVAPAVAPATAMTLAEQWRFAEAVTGSGGGILPKAYRQDPGAVLVAVNLGAAMGLSPAESLYRIHVVEGKPSASAELIAANVRRAGHRLRIRATNETATVQIIRADDPDFSYEVTWTIEDAQRAGLTGKDVWKKYPASMLRARAVTECARTACPEALYGVVYATEEVTDLPADRDRATPQPRETAADIVAVATSSTPPSRGDDAATTSYDDAQESADPAPITDRTRGHVFALLAELGITDPAQQRAGMSQVLGRKITTRSALTEDDGRALVIDLEARKAAAVAGPDEEAADG